MYYINYIATPTRKQQMTKTTTRYEVREYTGNEYSKRLGQRLRTRTEASRVCKLLKKQGRSVFAAAMKVAA